MRRGKRGEQIGVKRHLGSERLGFRVKQSLHVLEVHLKMGFVPESQVGASILIVVHLVDATLRPRLMPIPINCIEAILFGGGAEFHRFSERAVLHLNEYPESIKGWHYQIIQAVPVHVMSDVNMRERASGRRFNRRDFRQRVFCRRLGLKPIQPPGFVGNQPVAPIDVRHVNEQHIGPQRCLKFLPPGAFVKGIDAHTPVAVHHDNFRDIATEQEPG